MSFSSQITKIILGLPDKQRNIYHKQQRCQIGLGQFVCNTWLYWFLCHFRSNNWSIPILVGGDFNMDMKSYDISDHPELLFVPYRPLSGKNLRDFKNTFLFTLDNLQVNIQVFMKKIIF